MLIRRPIILLAFIILHATSAYADTTANDCTTVKDAKKRLACFDNANKQASSTTSKVRVSPANSSGETNQNIAPAVQADRAIAVETGLVYRSGDIKPVARTEFYLLDEGLLKIFTAAGLKPPMDVNESTPGYKEIIYPQIIISSFGMIHTRINEFTVDNDSVRRYKQFHAQAIEAIRPHIVQTATTDFSGKVRFNSIMPGTYYLMGIYRTPNDSAVWDYKVIAQNSETLVTLDQNNAAYIK